MFLLIILKFRDIKIIGESESKMNNKSNKSKDSQNKIRIVKKIEKKNDRFSKKDKLIDVEMNSETKNPINYDLLLTVEEKKDNYTGVIEVLEDAINNSDNKEKYRKLRKKIIMKKILSDMNIIKDNGAAEKLG